MTLRSVEELYGYDIHATDGRIGEVDDFYFEDAFWAVRYLVVDTGEWLTDRRVLVAGEALGEPNWVGGVLPVALNQEQIAQSPPIDSEEPVSRQHERQLAAHYGWEYYWLSLQFPFTVEELGAEELPAPAEDDWPQLRSSKEVENYHVNAVDGRVGHIEDFLLDDEEWIIRHLVVDTRDWLPGKTVLLATEWVQRLDWTNARAFFDLTRETIKGSPRYDKSRPVSRTYEETLYDYYAQPKYWI